MNFAKLSRIHFIYTRKIVLRGVAKNRSVKIYFQQHSFISLVFFLDYPEYACFLLLIIYLFLQPTLIRISKYSETAIHEFKPLLRSAVKWSDTLQKSCCKCCKISKVCLTTLRHCEIKG